MTVSLDFDPPWPATSPEIRQRLERLLSDQRWGVYEGIELHELREQLGSALGRRFVHLCASGTIGVELALRGLGVTAGDTIALAGYDFPGNFRAIEALQAIPLLLDVKPGGWSLDAEALQRLEPPYPKAIIVSHLHGDGVDLRRLRELTEPRGILIVEDACQAHGASIQGVPAGGSGHVSVLSFGGSKLLSAGRGGAVLTDDPAIDQRLKIAHDRGNLAYPLSELQAAVLLPQLNQLAAAHATRRDAYLHLQELTKPLRTLRLGPLRDESSDPAFYKVPLTTPTPQALSELESLLTTQGVPCGSGFRGFWRRSARRCQVSGDLAHARRASETTLLLGHGILRCSGEARERLAQWLIDYDQKITTAEIA